MLSRIKWHEQLIDRGLWRTQKWINNEKNQVFEKEDFFGNSLFEEKEHIIFVRWCVLSNEASSLGERNKVEREKVEWKGRIDKVEWNRSKRKF